MVPHKLSWGYAQSLPVETNEANVLKQAEYVDEYAPIYRQEVARDYELSVAELQAIVLEGVQNDWPMPTP